MTESIKAQELMMRATRLLAQKRARELLSENRARLRQRNRRRHDLMRRRLELGDLVRECGLEELDLVTLKGLMLQGRDHARSPTEKLAMRRRGEDPDGKRAARVRPIPEATATQITPPPESSRS